LQPPRFPEKAQKPSAKVSLESKSIAAGIGVTWGEGKLNFKGKDHPFSIDGLTVVDIGIIKQVPLATFIT
jgi:hypothetical protein